MTTSLQIVIAGGGCYGHLQPGLSIASSITQMLPRASILFAGTGRPLERHLVRSAGYNYVSLPCQPIPENPLQALRFVTDNVAGFWAARWMLREQKISLVVGLGGYASAPVVRAAVGRGIPTVLLEQNAVPGLSTRWLAPMVEAVCIGYPQVRGMLPPQSRVLETGIPGRPGFSQRWKTPVAQTTEPARRERRLVILGGAGGAHTLNQHMPGVLSAMRDVLAGWRIVHQTGDGQLQGTSESYARYGVDALTVSYVDDLASLLYESDIVICRAGGTTLAELALAGVPAMVVPYPDSSDDHQLANAEHYRQAGACVVVDEEREGANIAGTLQRELRILLADSQRLRDMRTAMLGVARPEAATQIATECLDILGGSATVRRAA